jgi:S-adenosylmethionine/arginine decarboxylase-like enzyme
MKQYSTRGKHVVVDVYNFTRPLSCRDVIECARNAGMTVLGFDYVRGSIALILAESHLTVHRHGQTYFIDVFTCGDSEPMNAVRELLRRCGGNARVYEWVRGVVP